MMGIYYAVERSKTTGPVEAGTDAIDARFWRPEEFEASDQVLKELHSNPFWFDDLSVLLEVAGDGLDRERRYSTLVAPHCDG
jgi:hypothetical protein